MAGEKFVVAAVENPLQIAVRNILNPFGYIFLGNCSDSITLLRQIRSCHPDFAVVDMNMQAGELRHTLEVIDNELLCACVLIGDSKNIGITGIIENTRTVSFCPKPLNRDMLLHITEMTLINYRRVLELDKKLKEATENYETRKAVERAKWILMERDGLSEKDAYERIRKKSMNDRMSMKSIAEAIIFTYEIMKKQ